MGKKKELSTNHIFAVVDRGSELHEDILELCTALRDRRVEAMTPEQALHIARTAALLARECGDLAVMGMSHHRHLVNEVELAKLRAAKGKGG